MMPENIFMVGVGGIGMSALAQLLKHQGKNVSGSDREESPTTELLVEQGIDVCIGHDGCVIPPATELLIYSDAVWPDNPERMRAKDMNIPEMSYYEALGTVSENMRTIAVSGTHGKTTTTGMLAAILHAAGVEPTAIVGSIVRDFDSNFLAGKNDLLVVEACEYKNHLLKLSPEILVITNIELDHTDFFPSLAAMQETFKYAINQVPAHGAIVTDASHPSIAPLLEGVEKKIIDYTLEDAPKLEMIGEFNAMNARAAKAAARIAFPEISEEVCDGALEKFRGSWRRFEYKGETKNGAIVYDDYAHHPTAIEKTLSAARMKFPDKKIIIAFHPHLYSRTKSFQKEFAQELAKADEAIIAPIYAAREENDPTVSNEIVAAEARAQGGNVRALNSFDEIRDALNEYGEGTLIITMGAGDIYKVAEQITEE